MSALAHVLRPIKTWVCKAPRSLRLREELFEQGSYRLIADQKTGFVALPSYRDCAKNVSAGVLSAFKRTKNTWFGRIWGGLS